MSNIVSHSCSDRVRDCTTVKLQNNAHELRVFNINYKITKYESQVSDSKLHVCRTYM